MARFTDRVALVTGAGSGIGRATALRLADEGAVVGCLDVAIGACEKTAADIVAAGGRANAYHCDVSSAESVLAAVESLTADLGAPRVVCNIAGIGRFAHSHEQTLAEWQRMLDVNLTGTFLVIQACLPALLEHGGVVVNTASTAGLIGQPYSAAYCASKGGVVMLTKSLAWEYVERGVRFNAVAPGGVETNIINDFMPPPDASMRLLTKIMTPMGFAQPEEAAGVFAFLASDEARYVNGSIYSIDGGVTI
jgi:NAD(P)-dependent dehydrogenase (short-subunit alcohol dehydrogenase family)